MAYTDFKLSERIKIFGLTLSEAVDLFANVAEVEGSENQFSYYYALGGA